MWFNGSMWKYKNGIYEGLMNCKDSSFKNYVIYRGESIPYNPTGIWIRPTDVFHSKFILKKETMKISQNNFVKTMWKNKNYNAYYNCISVGKIVKNHDIIVIYHDKTNIWIENSENFLKNNKLIK